MIAMREGGLNMSMTTIPVITNDAELDAAHEEIERLLMENPPVDSAEGARLEAMIVLAVAYEKKHFPIEPLSPIEHIEFAMERHGLTRRDLEPVIGGSGRVSEILNRDRPLTLPMIRGLSELLRIPVDLLVADYPLRTPTPRRRLTRDEVYAAKREHADQADKRMAERVRRGKRAHEKAA
jgi:HTH-type transcriptional regulator/antitoxin HigA